MSDEERQQEVNGDSNQEAMDIIQGIPDPLKQGLSEEPNTEVVKPNDNSNEEAWLIKDKFRNDDNGRDALTKAYRELQSEKDKISGEIKKQATELQPLRQMDEFLKENPKIVEKLAAEVEREQKGLQSPPKPEDYDVYDESVDELLHINGGKHKTNILFVEVLTGQFKSLTSLSLMLLVKSK